MHTPALKIHSWITFAPPESILSSVDVQPASDGMERKNLVTSFETKQCSAVLKSSQSLDQPFQTIQVQTHLRTALPQFSIASLYS
jgi:hypothetical protein